MSDDLPLRRRLRRRFWHLAARAVLAMVERAPDRAGRAGCRLLARAAWRWRPRERDLARRNVAIVFAQADPVWREALLARATDALGDNLHTALSLPRLAASGYGAVDDLPGPDGRGLVETLRRLQDQRRGVIVATAHLGCWELLAAWLAARLSPTAVITATVRNPAVDRLLQERRRRLGLTVLPRDRGARPVLRALDQGAVVGAVLDQNTRAASVPVPFCGRPAPTPLGLLELARRRGTPIVPAAMVRQGGRWVTSHLEPLSGAESREVLHLAAACNDALEALIRRNPDQWVWFHDRWGLRAAAERP